MTMLIVAVILGTISECAIFSAIGVFFDWIGDKVCEKIK